MSAPVAYDSFMPGTAAKAVTADVNWHGPSESLQGRYQSVTSMGGIVPYYSVDPAALDDEDAIVEDVFVETEPVKRGPGRPKRAI